MDTKEAANVETFAGRTLRKAPQLWFEDGNIILRTGEYGSRLYRGLLAQFSTVLSNMFEDAASLGDCPVIDLDDSPSEFECFLRGLIYPLGLVDDFGDAPPYSALHILKMCDKYGVGGKLRLRALQYLATLYPTTLEHIDDFSDELESSYARFTGGGENYELNLHFRVIKLATDIGISWILPFALYRCAILATPSHLVDGLRTSDMEVIRLDDHHLKLCLDLQRRGPRPGDLGLVDHAIQSIPECTAHPGNYYQPSHTHWGQSQSNTMNCPRARTELLQQTLSSSLIDITRYSTSGWETLGICEKCRANMDARYRRDRESFWAKLPSHLELPGWEKLLVAKRQTLRQDADSTCESDNDTEE